LRFTIQALSSALTQRRKIIDRGEPSKIIIRSCANRLMEYKIADFPLVLQIISEDKNMLTNRKKVKINFPIDDYEVEILSLQCYREVVMLCAEKHARPDFVRAYLSYVMCHF